MRSRWLPRVVLTGMAIYLLIAIPVGLRNTFLRLRLRRPWNPEPPKRISDRPWLAHLQWSRL